MLIKDIGELRTVLETLKEIYHTENGEREQLNKLINEKEEELKKIKKEKEFYTELLVLLQEASYEAREQSKERIEKLVTKPLQFIFGENTRLEVELKNKGENSTANISVITDYDYGTVGSDPADGDGGGIADTVALASLTTLLLTSDTGITAPLMLDEPLKFLSKGNSANGARFLHGLSTSFDKQIIMSTHVDDIAAIADKAFRFQLKKGITEVSEEE